MRKNLPLVISAALLVAAVPLVRANRPPRLPAKADLLGVWVGYDKAFPNFYRLRLGTNDTGRLVVLHPGDSPDVYSLNWAFGAEGLSLQAAPESGSMEPITCSVTNVDFREMELTISGASTNRWTRSAVLLQEGMLSRMISESARYDEK